ncbi:patatin-like phospholipase family protein [Chitinophaga qingshengii]|uniref:Patatin-like phospholipase family protein n=1 Tax=Chitinophaga qingshengii TaxID=1569794 RepID=A0ABR7TZE8_9BACT|nr:patatin-like phospholipase family protein [Chitinophaga qingshengii]MBC9935036.1 patatin-like phospholipase family protein [Chitinophaga qingshengii]
MNVLITSGGGAKGAFSVGALRQLMTTTGIRNFDLISGTSTGALIAAMVAAGKIPEVTDIYLSNSNADILNKQNAIDNIINNKPYLYDTTPLENQIRQQMTDAAWHTIQQSPALLCLNAVCLQTGRLTVFSSRPLAANPHYDNLVISTTEMLVKALQSSSNQAVFMPPVTINGLQYVDGGNREVIPTRAVVSNLPPQQEHRIYILSNNPDAQQPGTGNYTALLDVLMRAVTIFIQEVRENDLEVLSAYKQSASTPVKVYYISPEAELDPDFPTGLRFDRLLMQSWMKQGQLRAKTILQQSPNGNW